jgi:hypothetical protein
MIGHCLGASGGLEAIATVKAITTGWLHPSINQFVCVRSFPSYKCITLWFFRCLLVNSTRLFNDYPLGVFFSDCRIQSPQLSLILLPTKSNNMQ